MIKLGFTPRACCWVHRREQAQGLLAMSVVKRCAFDHLACLQHSRSEHNSGTIRLYDGRGGDTPLETTTKLHRYPVHVMTVRHPEAALCNINITCIFSTATDTMLLFQPMKGASSNTGNLTNLLNSPRTSPVYGRSKVRLIYMSSKR